MTDTAACARPSGRRPSLRHRLAVASRVAAACAGGYFLAYGATAMLTVVLPMSRLNRVVTASLLSFAVWCAAAVWVFAARSAWRAWWPLLLGGGALLGGALLLRGYGARP
jgi:hypothetical protein